MTYRILYRCRECGQTFSDSSMPEKMAHLEMARLCVEPNGAGIAVLSMHRHTAPHQAPGEYCADFLGIAPEQP